MNNSVRGNLFGRMAIIACLWLSLSVQALQPGNRFESVYSDAVYEMSHWLGGGDFGQVWEAKVVGSSETYALKFYRNGDIARENLPRVRRVAELMAARPFPNLLYLYLPERVVSSDGGEQYDVVRSEIGEASVQALMPTEFLLQDGQDENERIRRFRNGYDLLQDLLAASEQLSKLSLVHHDINPRNVVKVGVHYKVADFDFATVQGEVPPLGSWEYSFGAIEYESSQIEEPLASMSDLFTLASTVYYTMFGSTPLADYAYQKFPDDYVKDPATALKNVRKLLFKDAQSRRDFDRRVESRLDGVLQAGFVPGQVLPQYLFVARVLYAALKADPGERWENVQATVPDLHQVQSPAFPSQSRLENHSVLREMKFPGVCAALVAGFTYASVSYLHSRFRSSPRNRTSLILGKP